MHTVGRWKNENKEEEKHFHSEFFFAFRQNIFFSSSAAIDKISTKTLEMNMINVSSHYRKLYCHRIDMQDICLLIIETLCHERCYRKQMQ